MDGPQIIIMIIAVLVLIAVWAYSAQQKEQIGTLLTEFAKIHGLAFTLTGGWPRLFGSLGGRSLTIETFKLDPRSSIYQIKILLSLNAPGEVYLKLKGRSFLFHTWNPEHENFPSLDILFEGESHPPDIITTLSTADPQLGYKLGRALQQLGGRPAPVLEVKAGQVS
jgi:hypothetical protein